MDENNSRNHAARANLSRREVIALAGGAGAAYAMGLPCFASGQTPATPLPSSFQEAPSLADLAAAGTIPPIADRLPANPMVVQPTEQVGTYGGQWRTAIVGGLDLNWLTRCVAYDYLVRWDPAWETIIPNIAAEWLVSDDGRSFTFTLREGHKWSDGQPFTVDDVMFYGEDVYANKELTPSPGDNPWTIERVDDLRFTVTFERPNGFFLARLSATDGAVWTRYPKHYMQQFHPNQPRPTGGRSGCRELGAIVPVQGLGDPRDLGRRPLPECRTALALRLEAG